MTSAPEARGAPYADPQEKKNPRAELWGTAPGGFAGAHYVESEREEEYNKTWTPVYRVVIADGGIFRSETEVQGLISPSVAVAVTADLLAIPCRGGVKPSLLFRSLAA